MMTGAQTRHRSHTILWMLVAVALLAGLIFSVHGSALRMGLFMDDHAHFRQLRASDWSLSGLTGACRLELIGGTIELWWLPECTLRFFRPVAFGLLKLTYTLSAWSPGPVHVASLLWHLATCVLLLVLLRRCGASIWLAWAVAALFAIHPGHVATVQWIACQTELMVTTFLLAATLCWGRFRGWPGFAPAGDTRARTAGAGWAVAAVALFVLALGCRENAVMFPFVMAAAEPFVWRQRQRSAIVLYAVLGTLLAAYLIVRSVMLSGAELPPRPYVMPLSDPGFARYVFDKAWYYLLGQFLMVPCVPFAGLPYLQAHPALFYGLAGGVGLVLFGVCWRCRHQGVAGLLGLAWLIGFMVPLLPVFAAPHHLYLPGIGWAVFVMLILRWIGTPGSSAGRIAARVRPVLMWCAVGLVGAVFVRGATWAGMALETADQVEDCLAAELAAAPSGLADGDTLYVANMPLIGHYARLAVEEQTGRRNLRVIPLTWAPRLLGPATAAELKWVDPQTAELRVADDRYFSGPLERLVVGATGDTIPDEADHSADYGFRVAVLERDADGIIALRFTFTRPLSDPGLHLFWASRTRWAYEVHAGNDE